MHYPRFVYTNDSSVVVDFTLTLPCRPWIPSSHGMGGREFSAARVPAHYEIRRDQKIRLLLRFTEAEWPQVRKMLEHAGRSTLVAVYLDGTSRNCYLLNPSLDDESEIEPDRARYPGDMAIDTEWVDNDDIGWDAVRAYG